jgi:hypothetical protein
MKTIPEARSQKPEVRNLTSDGCLPTSDLRLPTPRSGVALIITVILLAVVTFMALTFLAVSRRERGAVTTTTDTASAKLAADDALASAEAQIVANVLATTNPYNFGLLVSTNYINSFGFVPAAGANPTNVNYTYYHTGPGPLAPNDFLQNLANLYYLPRAPVLISATDPVQGRFYLDLNRNGRFDTNGLVGDYDNNNNLVGTINETGDPEWIGVLQHPDQPYGPNNQFVARYAFFAVPIGNALDLNANHDDTMGISGKISMGAGNDGFMRNQGVGSWEINLAAFLADLNTNQWGLIVGSGLGAPPGSAAYYQYNEPIGNLDSGAAFDDALSILTYRYNYNFNNSYNLASVDTLFGGAAGVGDIAFRNDSIDGYSDGPLQTRFQLPGDIVNPPNDDPTLSWSGADNTNQFFDLQELFNPNESSVAFTNRLVSADNAVSTYNRYTYYRLASQMGVESAPEQDKLNLNYRNETNGVIVPGMETNFYPWTALEFFTNAAARMLSEYSQEWQVENPSNFVTTFSVTNAFSITNIPVLVSNRFVYTPSVQRVLQLAANIYDATTNNTVIEGANFPSVFRPIFLVTNDTVSGYTNVYITGYEPVEAIVNGNEQIGAVSGPNDPQLDLPVDVTALLDPTFGFGTFTNLNVYGVPWIIGAKKGFPNFNEFAMESVFQLTRKLQVWRPNTNSPLSDYKYYQMFNLSLSNQFGVECWNSYTNDFLRTVAMYVYCTNSFLLTNDENFSERFAFTTNGFIPITPADNNGNGWPGYNPGPNPLIAPLSFQLPLNTSFGIVPTSMYRFNGGAPFLTTNLDLPFETGVNINGDQYPQPHWWLMTTNNVRVIILDGPSAGPNHVIDYVQLRGPDSVRDLTSEIISNYDTAAGPSGDDLWDTNIQAGMPIGLVSQIGVSEGNYSPGLSTEAWNSMDADLRNSEIDGFLAFFGYSSLPNTLTPGAQQAIATASMTNAIQAPYTPTATVVEHFSWQANDPLVHYTADDLNWPGADQLNQSVDSLTNEDLGKLNQRYMPWGGNPLLGGADLNPVNLALKDPLVWQSDDWDFPTYKMPTVGWLGRVHRGTPWQTVYLKSADVLQGTNAAGALVGTNVWAQWTGDEELASGQIYDAVNTAPAQDRLLFDNFTTAFDDNATRGTLSVNVGANDPGNLQAGLAAWSALLSGVIVLSNNAVDAAINPSVIVQHGNAMADFTWLPVNPAGQNGAGAALGQIVASINFTRATFTNADGLVGAFEHAGDVLSAPGLSVQSPFLNLYSNGTNDPIQLINGINDEMYEWLPQQVMSLLRVSGTAQSPVRYVIYSYGQTLKPAPNGIYTGNATLANGQSAFGMVTNYQVVAEAATRTVLRYNGNRVEHVFQFNDGSGNFIWTNVPSITNNQMVIERFNPLPAN